MNQEQEQAAKTRAYQLWKRAGIRTGTIENTGAKRNTKSRLRSRLPKVSVRSRTKIAVQGSVVCVPYTPLR